MAKTRSRKRTRKPRVAEGPKEVTVKDVAKAIKQLDHWSAVCRRTLEHAGRSTRIKLDKKLQSTLGATFPRIMGRTCIGED